MSQTLDLLKIAQKVRDGNATEQEKIELFRELNLDLVEISKILKEVKK